MNNWFTLFLSKNWVYLTIALAFIIVVILGNRDNALVQSVLKMSERANKRHEKLISDLKDVQKEKQKTLEISKQTFEKEIEEFNKKRAHQLTQLEKDQIEMVRKQLQNEETELDKIYKKWKKTFPN